MNPGSRVHIGSVTKTLLAAGLLRLASEGRLDLDDPVSKLVPQTRFDNPWEETRPVRVRHLLDHTAGLENLRVWQMFSKKVGPNDTLGSVFDRDPSVLRVRTPPGEAFSYSNIGYALAGLVIERVTGQRYEDWLDRHLLAPLGMSDSTFQFVSQVERADPRLAWGHGDNLTLHEAMPVALRPAAQFTTTAADMARFAQFLMSDGTVAGRAFIRPDLLRAMGQPSGTAAARAGLGSGYALGLTSRDRYGRVGRCHSGNIVGYRAMFCIFPEQQKAFFYSINTDGENADYGRLDKLLMQTLRVAPQPAAPVAAPAPDLADWSGHYVPQVSGIAMERLTDLLMEGVTLKLAATPPLLDHNDSDPAAVQFAGGYLLRATGRSLPSHAVFRDEQGRRMLSDGLRSFREVSAWKINALWGSLGLGLLGLVYLLLASPILAWRSRRSLFQPATLALLLLLPAGLLTAAAGFASFGDLTPGSGLIFLATLLLPIATLLQAWKAWRKRYAFWKPEVAACGASVQLFLVLASFGLLPLALWR
jgi:CubicO group peptidase (beta-lactamase class C family)